MGRPLTCDLCDKPMFEKFDETAYKIVVKRLRHAYDGYAPWVRKQTLDVCDKCMHRIIKGAHL